MFFNPPVFGTLLDGDVLLWFKNLMLEIWDSMIERLLNTLDLHLFILCKLSMWKPHLITVVNTTLHGIHHMVKVILTGVQ